MSFPDFRRSGLQVVLFFQLLFSHALLSSSAAVTGSQAPSSHKPSIEIVKERSVYRVQADGRYVWQHRSEEHTSELQSH